jgi:hypothetical protein
MSDEPTFDVEVEGTTYTLVPQPLRTSLSDSPAALWGFQVHVLRDGELVGIKTCFVGRVRVHTKDPAAADGPVAALMPILHDVAVGKIRERIEQGATGDEILFA